MLSSSVSKALQLLGGPDTERTVQFVELFDKFFDCVNVSSLSRGSHTKNSFKAPYYSGSDFRLKVQCIKVLLTYMYHVHKVMSGFSYRNFSIIHVQWGYQCKRCPL